MPPSVSGAAWVQTCSGRIFPCPPEKAPSSSPQTYNAPLVLRSTVRLPQGHTGNQAFQAVLDGLFVNMSMLLVASNHLVTTDPDRGPQAAALVPLLVDLIQRLIGHETRQICAPLQRLMLPRPVLQDLADRLTDAHAKERVHALYMNVWWKVMEVCRCVTRVTVCASWQEARGMRDGR